MKRIALFVLCLLEVCSFSACGSIAEHGNSTAQVTVINASSEEIYGIGCAWYVNGSLKSSGGGCNADNSAIKMGDFFDLDTKSWLEDTENVELELSVVSKSGKEYPCGSRIDVEIEDGTTCEIRITGDYKSGFDVSIGAEEE